MPDVISLTKLAAGLSQWPSGIRLGAHWQLNSCGDKKSCKWL